MHIIGKAALYDSNQSAYTCDESFVRTTLRGFQNKRQIFWARDASYLTVRCKFFEEWCLLGCYAAWLL
jgi:hypothetical protein